MNRVLNNEIGTKNIDVDNNINDFKKAIIENNINKLKRIDKTDIHNHTTLSCTKNYLLNNGIKLSDEKISDIQSFLKFSRDNVSPIKQKEEGLRLLIKGNLENCIETGVKYVCTQIDYNICVRTFNLDKDKFIDFLKSFKYDGLNIFWDISLSRDNYKEEYKKDILRLINTGFFNGIDLVSTENSIPNSQFIDFYNLANSLNMITKVHAGEQLGAAYIYECIKDFNPKQIQHGIHIVENENVMKIAKEREIVFNVCPTSNVVLGNAKSYKDHPIKEMVEYGLKVTINTDDLLVFDSDINEEYLKLYNEGTLSAKQLDSIRTFGLSLFENSSIWVIIKKETIGGE